jgi:isochorismate pyruvate lyase
MVINCNSIEEIRENIDRIDRQIVSLLSERGGFVKQAARFKKTADDVKAPARVEQVISKVVNLSNELGANPKVIEAVYRTMISAFINEELEHHSTIIENGKKP